ncbi:MAG: hypothetical protein M1838_005430 [Thelocarpon superellum]|nr:MAG: hypothetical protein M1838_005430 [Thelocarpon superellum]
MLALRDQENLLHGHQTAAAAKPPSQPTKNGPTNPPSRKAPKTPFKLPLNDENAPAALGGRSVGKANGATVLGTKKGGMGDRGAFVTPMGPRIRLPLGLKTTNAKAKAFQTPAPVPTADANQKTQRRSASARRPKSVAIRAETVKVEVKDDENTLQEEDTEYMPPKPIDLPDYPEDFPQDMEYPQFRNGNLMRGVHAAYFNPVDEHGITLLDKRLEEGKKQADKEFDEQMERIIEDMPLYGVNVPEFPGDEIAVAAQKQKEAEVEPMKKTVTHDHKPMARLIKPIQTGKGPSTKVSQEAATLLSFKPPHQAKPRPEPVKKNPRAPALQPKGVKATSTPRQTHHNAGAATSRTTIGYAKGRAASASMQAPKKPTGAVSATRSSSTTAIPSVSSQKLPPLFTAEEWGRMTKYDPSKDNVEDEDLEPALRGLTLSAAMRDEEAEEDFVLQW